MHQRFLLLAAILGALGVIIGAFGAHGFEGTLDLETAAGRKTLATYEAGVRYHLIHAVALMGVAILATTDARRCVHVAGWAFVVGILLFSGSLYILAVTGMKWLGMLAPIGGVILIIGWLALALAGATRK